MRGVGCVRAYVNFTQKYDALVAEGYAVTRQVPVGGYV
jgi:hypothetical protein